MEKSFVSDVKGVRALFARFTDEEISVQMALWGVKVLEPPKSMRSRASRIRYLLDTSFPQGITLRQAAELQIRAARQDRGAQHWEAFGAANQATPKVFMRAEEFEAELSRNLSSYFKHHTAVFSFDDSMWARICILEGYPVGKVLTRSKTIMLIYFPHHSRLLATSGIKRDFARYVYQAVSMTLGVEAIEREQLEGSKPSSLAELILNPQAQGPMLKYKRGKVDQNPLDSSTPKKIKTKAPPIERADAEKMANRMTATETAFGLEDQAGFEKLTFEIRGPWRGVKLPIEGVFPIKIRFEGPNVVEGLRELTTAGVLETPVPAYLANVHSLARNSFVVQDMNRLSEGDVARADADATRADDSE